MLAVLTGAIALVVLLGIGLAGLAQRIWSPVAPSLGPRCTAEVASDAGPLRAALSPEQTANAALISGIAQQRGLPARAASIALATAIQESGLRNIDYGDRDSLGLFQQRPSQDWGTEEQVQDPVYATNAFYDVLVRIDGYESLEVTDAAQRVQRSAFPEAYADHEAEGRALASALYGLSPAALTCRLPELAPVGEPQDSTASTELTPRARALADDLARSGPPGGTVSPAGSAGPTLVVEVGGAADAERTGWALAHTAVALAGRHDVVRVEVNGRVWERVAGDSGWAALDMPASEAGRVRVTVQ